jgi:hypothetical protein
VIYVTWQAHVWISAALAALGVAALEAGSGGMSADATLGAGGGMAGAIGLWQPIFFGLGFYRE